MKIEKVKTLGRKNGTWKEFNKHAVLISEGSYIDDKKDGIWREYYDHSGSIMIEETYNHGIQHGRYASFHPNGQLWSEGSFDHGKRNGYFRVHDENGNNTRNMLFINDIQYEVSSAVNEARASATCL